MQISSLLQKFGRDLIYLLVIGGMAGWIWMDAQKTKAWDKLASNDLKLATLLLENYNQHYHQQKIAQDALEYPSAENDYYQNRAKLAEKLTAEKLTQKIPDLNTSLISFQTDKSAFPTRPLTQTEIQSLKNSAAELADALIDLADHEQRETSMIKSTLLGDNDKYWLQWQNIGINRTPAMIQDLRFRANAALSAVLNYCQSKISPGIICDNGWTPGISTYRSAIRPGDIYQAEIFFSAYATRSDDMFIKVDGKSLPIKDGLATFAKRYTTPGEKKYTVEIGGKNRLTGEIITRSKEFSLLVVDSCR